MTKKLKVFHGLVNYGTQAGLFAKALRGQGIEALSVSYPDRFKRLIDVELLHGGSIVQKVFKHSWNRLRFIYWFFKYNTFHFYYGTTLFPHQRDLPFYRLFGKKVIMHYLGKDVKTYKETIERYSINNMIYSSGSEQEAILNDINKKARLAYESKFTSLQFVCSPIYSEFVEKSIFLPLAIDLNDYKFSPKKGHNEVLKIMHAPTSRANKGTEFINQAIVRLKEEGYKIEYMLCENISHKELKLKYEECDIFIDQVLGGYGTAAIEAMAIGRPTISYLRDIHFNDLTYPEGIPIIVGHKDNIYEVIKDLIEKKETLFEIGIESRKFVERNHDVNLLTHKLIAYYNKIHNK